MNTTRAYLILLVCTLLLPVSVILPVSRASGQIRATVQIEGLPKVLVKNSYSIIARSVGVESAKVVSIAKFRKASGTLSLPGTPSNIFVDYIDYKTKKRLYGISQLLRPLAGKRYKVKVKMMKKLSLGKIKARAAMMSGLPQGATVGIPSSAFTASGPGMGPHIASGEAAMLITDLIQAPCYKNAFRDGNDFQQGEKFVIREMDPDKLAALQKEIDRTQTPAFDPGTRLNNRWQPANVLVNGSVVSNGTSITITVNVTDTAGNIMFSERASGPASQRFDVHDVVAKQLKDKFCEEQSVSIDEKSCEATTQCRCCPLEDPICYGRWWVDKWSGTAKGPVGSVFDVNIIASPDYGTLSCGGWTEDVVSNLKACRRTSEGQPESIHFEATRNIFPPDFPIHCVCPNSSSDKTTFLAEILTADNKYSADEQVMDCPQ